MPKPIKASDILRDERIFWKYAKETVGSYLEEVDEIFRQHGLQYLSQHKLLSDKKLKK